MSRMKNISLEGFGASQEFGMHHFRVDIPAAPNASVRVTEDFGLSGGDRGVPYEEERVVIPHPAWSSISDVAKRDFNARLRSRKLPVGKWTVGQVKVERLLGKELCVLAWAAELATKEELPIIARKWAALRPEERWWLFMMTAAEAGRSEDKDRGWRVALHAALSDAGDGPGVAKPRRRPKKEFRALLLFPE